MATQTSRHIFLLYVQCDAKYCLSCVMIKKQSKFILEKPTFVTEKTEINRRYNYIRRKYFFKKGSEKLVATLI